MKRLYVSSYAKDDLKGIYIVDFNEVSLELNLVNKIDTKDFPSYIIRDNQTIYAAFKNASKKNDGGGIGSYQIKDDTLEVNNIYNSNGRSYTHLCLDETKHYIYMANYHVGSTASYKLENNKIKEKIGAIHHTGRGPDILKRQEGPHTHYVGLTPDKKFIYAVDLGADKVVMYLHKDGELIENHNSSLSVTPGSGPRHMVFSKDGKYAYLVCELSNDVFVYKYNDERLHLIQQIRTSPRHFKDFNAAAAIRLTNSGNHLFVSNRGHNSIAMYRVNQDNGKLALLYMVHVGSEPRDFNIIDDKYLIVASQKSDQLEVLTFNEETEELKHAESYLDIPEPVCVCI